MFDGVAFRGRLAISARAFAKSVAEAMRDDIRKTLTTGRSGGPPLHPFTTSEKGHNTKLFDTGELAEAVRVFQLGAFTFGVGFQSGRDAHGRMDIAAIAVMNEFGATIKVTEKMRKLLAARGFPLAAGTKRLVIPARPFIRPAMSRALKTLRAGLFGIRGKAFARKLAGG